MLYEVITVVEELLGCFDEALALYRRAIAHQRAGHEVDLIFDPGLDDRNNFV